MLTKALSGKHLTGIPLYGYKSDPENKGYWLVDEEAAEVVREIFKLCIEGYGVNQIETILNERGIDSPAVYKSKRGIKTRAKITFWGCGTVADILSRAEYIGHTVNCRYDKKSYKGKRSERTDSENWIIIENTHEAIIDKQTFNIVQKLRESTKRKYTAMGEMGVLNGMLYCVDCKRRMRIRRKTTSDTQSYVCGTYMSSLHHYDDKKCTLHSTPRDIIKPLILSEIRRVSEFAREREDEFIALVEGVNERATDTELRTAKKELTKAEQRYSELDNIIIKIYEDNASGRLTNERFDKMYLNYETEQSALKEEIERLKSQITIEQETRRNVDSFLEIVKRYANAEVEGSRVSDCG